MFFREWCQHPVALNEGPNQKRDQREKDVATHFISSLLLYTHPDVLKPIKLQTTKKNLVSKLTVCKPIK